MAQDNHWTSLNVQITLDQRKWLKRLSFEKDQSLAATVREILEEKRNEGKQ